MKKKVTMLTCDLDINTWDSSTTSHKNWFHKQKRLNVDGGVSSYFSAYETFVQHRFSSLG